MTNDSRITLASVADPYVLVSTEDDDLILVALRRAPSTEDEFDRRKSIREKDIIVDHSFYSDHVDLFKTTAEQLPASRYIEIGRPKVAQVSFEFLLMCQVSLRNY